jgi:hypothetical protein
MAVGQENAADVPPAAAMAAEMSDAPDGYEGLARIGEGGFAVVCRALDTRFDRTVALKILRSEDLDEGDRQRFARECLAIGRVSSHPNIVTVYDAGTTATGRPWLAMEYCSGGSLAQKVAKQGPLPVAEVISIGARLCGALTAAHEAGILHRDVKPHNVLLTSYGEPALADFGIASAGKAGDGRVDAGDTGEATPAAAATSTVAYTVVHAAPEILDGGVGTAAADIYSLGSTLYTLLAGRAPFASEASTGLAPLVTRILRNEVPVIARPGVPPALEKLLRSSMSARPADRPASAAELGATLVSLGRRLSTEEATGVSGSPGPAIPPTSARRLLVVLGGVMGLLLAAFMTLGFRIGGSGPDTIPPAATPPIAMAQTMNRPETQTQAGRAAQFARATQAAATYAPRGLAVTPGHNRGELAVTWHRPTRPDVVATVVYEGAGTARARAIVTYDEVRPGAVPQATLHGLRPERRVCFYAAHVISIGDSVTKAVSRPVCAVPR